MLQIGEHGMMRQRMGNFGAVSIIIGKESDAIVVVATML